MTRILQFVSLVLTSFTLSAQPGTIDLSYGVNGWATDSTWSDNEGMQAIVALPDGSSLAVAERNDTMDVRVFHFTVDGVLDTLYGDHGVAIINDPNGLWGDDRRGAVLQPDGKLLIGGSSYGVGGDAFACIRLLADGGLDSTFGVNGISRFNLSSNDDQPTGVLLLSTGKIFLYGHSELSGYWPSVARLNSDGSPDLTFNGTGFSNFLVPNFYTGEVLDAVELPDGRVLVCGYRVSGADVRAFVTRFLDNGTIDPSFQSHVYTIGDGTWLWGTGIALQPDGKAVISASISQVGWDIAGFRILDNGDLDSAFATNGFYRTGLAPAYAISSDVQLRPNGSVVLVGSMQLGTSYRRCAAVKLDANGEEDAGFATGGLGLYQRLSTSSDYAQASAYQPDGKLLLAGISGSRVCVLRIEDDLSTSVPTMSTTSPDLDLRFDPQANAWWWYRDADLNATASIETLDALGRTVRIQGATPSGSQVLLDTGDLPYGCYLLRIRLDQRIFSGRIQVSQ